MVLGLGLDAAEFQNSGFSGGDSASARLLGSLRGQLSMEMISQADRYFHRGAGAEMSERRRFLLGRWADALQPSGHLHTEEGSLSQMMPWLRVATELQPEDVEGYLLAAYWMERVAPGIEGAGRVLSEALRRHPSDYRVAMAFSKLHFRYRRMTAGRSWLNTAIRRWPVPLGGADEGARKDAVYLWQLRGVLEAYDGRTAEAIASIEEAVRHGRGMGDITAGARTDLDRLRAHPEAYTGNARVLARLVRSPRTACEHDHDGEPHAGHEAGDRRGP
jgi:tetratricopeptide (TPR) repeat protein